MPRQTECQRLRFIQANDVAAANLCQKHITRVRNLQTEEDMIAHRLTETENGIEEIEKIERCIIDGAKQAWRK